METIPLKDFVDSLKAQDVGSSLYACLVCPMCGMVQNADDLVKAGAGKSFDEVERYLGFSCVGRWTHNKPPPAKKDKGTQDGCNWTLGGLFNFHELEVIDTEGNHHPRFKVATKEQAQAHVNVKVETEKS